MSVHVIPQAAQRSRKDSAEALTGGADHGESTTCFRLQIIRSRSGLDGGGARDRPPRPCRHKLAIAELSQERIDAIVDAMAAAVTPQCEALARLAVEETGYGVVADKVQKNLFSADRVYRFIRPMKTVGVLQRLEDRKIVEIAEPFGVVAAIVPSTNPTSTAIYKILIALKARCAIVISPHPVGGAMHHAGGRDHERGRAVEPGHPMAASAG